MRLAPSAAGRRPQTAFSATLLLMASTLLSGVLGLVRTKYINALFGAGEATDAYVAAFQLPDMLSYFLVGGVASISLVTILNRYRQAGDEVGGDRALSVVLNAMVVILTLAIGVAEVLAPVYTRVFLPKFSPDAAALCTRLTRILLPAQLFFFMGGVLGSRLLVRKIFVYQAVTPLIYNLGILSGAFFLSRSLGIYSLAVGVQAGVVAGPAGFTAYGAFRHGLRYRATLDFRDPAFREWLRLTLPLMMGVSLAFADMRIMSYFASSVGGGIARLNVAKSLFNAPMTMLGSAAGAASLPFFSALYSQGLREEFAAAVNRSVSRVLSVSLLAGGWMVALSLPLIDLFRGGSFGLGDALATAGYFSIFAVSIAAWTAQALYSRSFYAAGDTVTPAVAGWAVTLVSIPVYGILFHRLGMTGLAIASDVGMVLSTGTLAVLLARSGLVRLNGLEWGELGKALVAAVAGFAAAATTVRLLALPRGHGSDLLGIAAGSVAWGVAIAAVLRFTGSRLPAHLLARRRG